MWQEEQLQQPPYEAIVAAVMDARRPNMQENGREIARAPDPILLARSCSRKPK